MQSTEMHHEVNQKVNQKVNQQSQLKSQSKSLPSQPRFYWSRQSKTQLDVDCVIYHLNHDSIEALVPERN
jgi:hypothetical protein